ncbi:recombinase family protein [Mesorhizobium sp. M1406]
MMKIGYARVSTEDQKMDLQLTALEKAGCDQIFSDHGLSGKSFDRPGLKAALEALKPGDKLVVWRLDRLGRSLIKLVQLMDELGKRQIEFHSLMENIDTSSSGGRLVFHMMAALSEFERALISERTRAGMEAARQRGRKLGRRPSLTPDQLHEAALSISRKGEKVLAVAKHFDVTSRSLRRMLLLASSNQTV